MVLLLAVAAWFARRPWLSFLAALAAVPVILLGVLESLTDESMIYKWAVEEGCVSRVLDNMNMLLNVGLMLGCFLLGFWQRRSRAMIRT
ncbi:hypothetical protein C5L14_22255 [Labrys okinawensis]|uniref:Uncharacterized protein n=2 Tax=Labrys okinawensis TaxID=346911 RepID=A0A2S9Q756_9HYPH|nr:hypothetical protein C5L14_22255 [Labrys okinawensis]